MANDQSIRCLVSGLRINRLHRGLLIAIVLVCASCVWTSPFSAETKPFRAEKINTRASFGVVSFLSDEMHLRYDGYSVLQNRHFKTNVSNWRINELLSDTIRRILVRNTTHRVGILDNRGLIDLRTGKVFMYSLFERAEDNQFDIVVSVRPYVPHETHYWENGYGLWGSSQWRSVQSHCAFSWVVIDVWDVRTKNKIGSNSSRTCNRDETIEVKDRLAQYSAVEQAVIERDVKRSLELSAISALNSLGLY